MEKKNSGASKLDLLHDRIWIYYTTGGEGLHAYRDSL